MTSILLTGSAVDPLSPDEAKTFLRLEQGDDDQIIAALIEGARMYVETRAQIALTTQSWRLAFDCWPWLGRIAEPQ